MNVRLIMLGAAAVLATGSARAAVVYDTVNVAPSSRNAGWDWVDPTAQGPLAASFTATSNTSLTSVSLELSADDKTDGGSLVVVLIPNSNGSPGTPASFVNDKVLGTIQDSALTSTASPSLVNFSAYAPLAAGTTYWIGLLTPQLPSSIALGDSAADGTYGSPQWWRTSPNPGNAIGAAAQQDLNTTNGNGVFAAAAGDYEMIVNTPEPATLAILGGGLISLGSFRRRRANKA